LRQRVKCFVSQAGLAAAINLGVIAVFSPMSPLTSASMRKSCTKKGSCSDGVVRRNQCNPQKTHTRASEEPGGGYSLLFEKRGLRAAILR